MNHPVCPVGSVQVCAETGKSFTVTTDGFTFNYATNTRGEIISDEGVNIQERRELLDRSKPFYCYLSGDGRHVTGWKGNILGTVESERSSRSGWHGSSITRITVRDVHGAMWSGRGAGRCMCITLRPMKGRASPTMIS